MHELCNAADGQLHNGETWHLFKHLLDETKTKSHQRDRLAKLLHLEIMKSGAAAVRKTPRQVRPDDTVGRTRFIPRSTKSVPGQGDINRRGTHSPARPEQTTGTCVGPHHKQGP